MEENKFDLNTFIGFMLIGGILLYMLYQNQPDPIAQGPAETQATESVAQESSLKDIPWII